MPQTAVGEGDLLFFVTIGPVRAARVKAAAAADLNELHSPWPGMGPVGYRVLDPVAEAKKSKDYGKNLTSWSAQWRENAAMPTRAKAAQDFDPAGPAVLPVVPGQGPTGPLPPRGGAPETPPPPAGPAWLDWIRKNPWTTAGGVGLAGLLGGAGYAYLKDRNKKREGDGDAAEKKADDGGLTDWLNDHPNTAAYGTAGGVGALAGNALLGNPVGRRLMSMARSRPQLSAGLGVGGVTGGTLALGGLGTGGHTAAPPLVPPTPEPSTPSAHAAVGGPAAWATHHTPGRPRTGISFVDKLLAGSAKPSPAAPAPDAAAEPSVFDKAKAWLGDNWGYLAGAGALGLGGVYLLNRRKKKRDADGDGIDDEDETKESSESSWRKRAQDPPPVFDKVTWNPASWGNAAPRTAINEQIQHSGALAGGAARDSFWGGTKDFLDKNNWARWALYGAPIGAGIGLLGGVFGGRKKKRNVLGDALTGGLLGAVGGGLAGGAYDLWGAGDKAPPKTELAAPTVPGQGVNPAGQGPPAGHGSLVNRLTADRGAIQAGEANDKLMTGTFGDLLKQLPPQQQEKLKGLLNWRNEAEAVARRSGGSDTPFGREGVFPGAYRGIGRAFGANLDEPGPGGVAGANRGVRDVNEQFRQKLLQDPDLGSHPAVQNAAKELSGTEPIPVTDNTMFQTPRTRSTYEGVGAATAIRGGAARTPVLNRALGLDHPQVNAAKALENSIAGRTGGSLLNPLNWPGRLFGAGTLSPAAAAANPALVAQLAAHGTLMQPGQLLTSRDVVNALTARPPAGATAANVTGPTRQAIGSLSGTDPASQLAPGMRPAGAPTPGRMVGDVPLVRLADNPSVVRHLARSTGVPEAEVAQYLRLGPTRFGAPSAAEQAVERELTGLFGGGRVATQTQPGLLGRLIGRTPTPLAEPTLQLPQGRGSWNPFAGQNRLSPLSYKNVLLGAGGSMLYNRARGVPEHLTPAEDLFDLRYGK